MFTLNCRGRLLVGDHPLVMGIINVTPDSFYSGSRATDENRVLAQAEQMLEEGADLIDLGAQSTRPHAAPLSAEEELMRLAGLVELVCRRFPEAILSIDTFYSRVAREAVLAGASVINDISAGESDDQMLATAAALHTPFICMHMRGTPQTMMARTAYDDVAAEVLDHLIARVAACRAAGIADVIADPGFGFSKNSGHSFDLLSRLRSFQCIGVPLLVGLSRKSAVYKTLGITPGEALNGSTVLHTIALMNGADILRVHDVKAARECVRLFGHYVQHKTPPEWAGFTK